MPATIRRTSTVWGSEGPPAVVTRPRRGGGAERTRVRDVVRGGSSSSSKKDKSGSPQAVLKAEMQPFRGRPGRFRMTRPSEGTATHAPNRGLMETTDELPTEVAAPLVLGRYRLGDRLGAGGFGTVYAATDERLQRAVAVKVIPSGPRDRDPVRGRREALAAGRLDHPGVVAVFDAGEDDRARYLVSELVYGRTVDELCARRAADGSRRAAHRPRTLRCAGARARPRRGAPRRQAAERDRPRRAALGGRAWPSSRTSASRTWPATIR